ncbi:helix-turn-helix domain-containing protein [Sphingomonas aquatilis]
MTACALGMASERVLARVSDACERPRAGGGFTALPRARSGGVHRTGAPVLRGSLEAGTFEEAFFAVPTPGETDRLLTACRRARDAGRRLAREARAGTRILSATERRLAALTGGAVRVFEEICTLARLNRGRVFPSYDWLAEATGLGRATIARAIVLLEAAGFLVRQRRFARDEGAGGSGDPRPRYRQTSNAYRALLPASVRAYLPRWLRPAPLPDDQVQREADRREADAAMRATLSCRELAQASVGGALGRMLARLGARIDAACESQNDPQPLTES